MPPATRSASPQPNPVAAPEEPEEMIEFLERDQLVAGTVVPVAPATLSRAVQSALWALRVFVIVVSAMVVYVFIDQLG